MSAEQMQTKEILSNFDTVMLDKASKFSVIELENTARKAYLEKHHHFDLEKITKEKFQSVDVTQKNFEEKFRILLENITSDINTAVKRVMNSKMNEKKIEGGPRVLFEIDYTNKTQEEA